MAGSINKVILIGNLGKDPEVKRMDTNVAVANFSIATSETFIDKNTNERRENTDWHNIVCWRYQAEFVEKFLKKGMKIYVEGRLKTRSWQDKENNTRYTTEVLADTIQVMNWNDGPNQHQEKTVYQTDTTPQESIPTPTSEIYNFEDTDDLPF
jgi:single-strand DNA-binding protein